MCIGLLRLLYILKELPSCRWPRPTVQLWRKSKKGMGRELAEKSELVLLKSSGLAWSVNSETIELPAEVS